MLEDVAEVAERWSEAPPLAECVRAYLGVKTTATEFDELDHGLRRELTEEEWKAMCEREKRHAVEENRPRNPFL